MAYALAPEAYSFQKRLYVHRLVANRRLQPGKYLSVQAAVVPARSRLEFSMYVFRDASQR